MEAYIRVGNKSVIAPDYIVKELILKGTNQSFDTLTTDAVKKHYSFTLLEATYLERTGLRYSFDATKPCDCRPVPPHEVHGTPWKWPAQNRQ